MEVEFENLFSQLPGLVPPSLQESETLKFSLVNLCYQSQDDRQVKRGLVTPEHLKRLKKL